MNAISYKNIKNITYLNGFDICFLDSNYEKK